MERVDTKQVKIQKILHYISADSHDSAMGLSFLSLWIT